MTYTVYILRCADSSLYTGCTNDLKKRIVEHNESLRGAKYTKGRRPVRVVHTEEYKSFKKAREREAEIKRLSRKKKLILIRGK